MNNDELKMIEEMAEVITQASDKCFDTACEDCKYCRADDDYYRCKSVFEAEALYNAKYRRVDDDEIIIKKSKIDTMIWTVGELAKKLTHSQHETAKEILQIVDGKLDLYRNGVIGGTLYDDGYKNAVNEIKVTVKNKYDLELEQSLNENDERY